MFGHGAVFCARFKSKVKGLSLFGRKSAWFMAVTAATLPMAIIPWKNPCIICNGSLSSNWGNWRASPFFLHTISRATTKTSAMEMRGCWRSKLNSGSCSRSDGRQRSCWVEFPGQGNFRYFAVLDAILDLQVKKNVRSACGLLYFSRSSFDILHTNKPHNVPCVSSFGQRGPKVSQRYWTIASRIAICSSFGFSMRSHKALSK